MEARWDMGDQCAAHEPFMQRLFGHGIYLETGVPGVYGRGPVLRGLAERLEALIDELCEGDGAERVWFPPVMPRDIVCKSGYLENFPHLCGSVHAFSGDERDQAALLDRAERGEDWGSSFAQTELVLCPAACYPLYPTLGGTLPAGGRVFDLTGLCFRHEPSGDPARLQSFELRENVRVGSPQDVRAWRARWMQRGQWLADALGLRAELRTASDPFFGRGGRLMAASQQEQALKFELVVPLWSDQEPTAVASFNDHQDKFGSLFGIRTHDGACAHSACLGFGIDRLAVALLQRHGLSVAQWPGQLRARLWP